MSRNLVRKEKFFLFLNKEGKFLKKLWCCVARGVLQDNLFVFFSSRLIM